MIKRAIITVLTLGLISISCDSDDKAATQPKNETPTKEKSEVAIKKDKESPIKKDEENSAKKTKASKIEGDDVFFIIDDNKSDFITNIKLIDVGVGTNSIWVITDNKDIILNLPKTISDVKKIDFKNQNKGISLLRNLNYENGLKGLEKGKSATKLIGDYSFSNTIKIIKNDKSALSLLPKNKKISGGPFNFVIDGKSDFVKIKEESADNLDFIFFKKNWVITDKEGKILGLPKTLADVEKINFDTQGEGDCFIWLLAYIELEGLEKGKLKKDLKGTFEFSNSIKVTRSKK